MNGFLALKLGNVNYFINMLQQFSYSGSSVCNSPVSHCVFGSNTHNLSTIQQVNTYLSLVVLSVFVQIGDLLAGMFFFEEEMC